MKLYLTSYRIPAPKDLLKLLGHEFSSTKVAVIPNAKDYLAERARSVKIQDGITYLSKLGFNEPPVVDLRDFNDTKKLKNKLGNYDFIWVMGGNTFCLRYEMRRSGFDKTIRELLNSGLVYGGESAGAVTAGNSLVGVEFEDNPNFSESIVWEGLNLIDRYILPHADNVVFAEGIEETRKMHKNNPKLIELKDSEALVVNDAKMEKVGA